MTSETRDRINNWICTLKKDFYKPLGEIQWRAGLTDRHFTLEETKKLEFVEAAPGFTWGRSYEYCWFKGKIRLPEEGRGKRIVLNLEPGGESTVFVDGEEFGTYRSLWIREKHHFYVDHTIAFGGEAGREYDIAMETYAGHYYPTAPSTDCSTGPVLPGDYEDRAEEGKRRTLGVCTFGIWNEDAYQLCLDALTLWKLYETLDQDSLRAAKIAEGLKQFTFTVDFEQEEEERQANYRAAREGLRPLLEAKNGTTAPVFYAVGNAHLDLAWLWPVEETERKTARTFASQLRLLEEYPDYRFIQSQPAEYEMCRKHYPKLFQRIKEAVKGGRWIADGAMWVEPDTNMVSGESLIRQLLYGLKYYKEVLGVSSSLLWLPDTFGYTAALPQILKGCGVRYLVTQKIFWSYNEGERFPYHYFRWIGMDGSKITSFLPTSYTYEMGPDQVGRVWKERTQKENLEAFLYPFGYGDGGGGPARDHLELGMRQQDLEGGPRMKFSGPMEFFEELEERGGPKDSYTGELYFSAHRGTYTSQAKIKRYNRKCELKLHDLELTGAMASLKGWAFPHEKLEKMWKTLLTNQFHDILPGSSIKKVYDNAKTELKEVLRQADEAIMEAGKYFTAQGQEGITALNTLSFPRTVLLKLPKGFEKGAVTTDGAEVPLWNDGEEIRALVPLPACGYVGLRPKREGLETKPRMNSDLWPRAWETEEGFILENSRIRAVIDEKGQITSFQTKDTGREFAAGRLNEFLFYKDVPRIFDAWDIDSNYLDQRLPGIFETKLQLLREEGPEAGFLLEGRIGSSLLRQKITLRAGETRLEFETEVDWKELHRLLKVSFPVEVLAENGKNEIQFGFVERPTHRSKLYDKDRYEVCNHKYSALFDSSHGAAVLNDCKYGISMNDKALELTLLRAPASPEMRADNGKHHFTYAFTAWDQGFLECDVVRQGYELNTEPVVLYGAGDSFSLLDIEKENIIMETLKPAEDGGRDLILRFYESKKAAVRTKINVHIPYKAVWLCDMLENRLERITRPGEALFLEFKAFEVKTLRLEL